MVLGADMRSVHASDELRAAQDTTDHGAHGKFSGATDSRKSTSAVEIQKCKQLREE